MKTIKTPFKDMVAAVPQDIRAEAELSFAISERLDALIKERGLGKKEFAEAFGCRPSEVTKWLSGQHNFTIRTLARLSVFFGEPLVVVGIRVRKQIPDKSGMTWGICGNVE